MSKILVQVSILWVLLIISQVIVFNNICLFGVAVPFVFIYFIVRLPITMPVNAMLTLAFLSGLTVDIFANTQGMNALACTVLAMSRSGILHLYFPREDELSDPRPTIATLGVVTYCKYLFSMVFVYCMLIFLIEACTVFDIIRFVLKVVCSTLLTFVLLLGLDNVLSHRH